MYYAIVIHKKSFTKPQILVEKQNPVQTYEITFLYQNKVIYTYVLSIDKDSIISERLDRQAKRRGTSMTVLHILMVAIEDLTEEDYQVLKTIVIDSVPVNLRARIADVLWTQKKEYSFALDAAEAYLELYQTLFNKDNWVGVLDYVKRAIYISAQIKKRDIYEKCCEEVFNQIIAINGEDEHFLSIKLLEIMLDENYGDKERIISIIDKIIRDFQTDVNKVESAYELKIKFLEKIKNNKAIKEANIALAGYLLNFGEGIIRSSKRNT